MFASILLFYFFSFAAVKHSHTYIMGYNHFCHYKRLFLVEMNEIDTWKHHQVLAIPTNALFTTNVIFYFLRTGKNDGRLESRILFRHRNFHSLCILDRFLWSHLTKMLPLSCSITMLLCLIWLISNTNLPHVASIHSHITPIFY